jgi:hypothetical protein
MFTAELGTPLSMPGNLVPGWTSSAAPVYTGISLRVYTGAGAGTESAPQSGIALMSVDSAANDPSGHEVAAGHNSYEKYLRLKIDTAEGHEYANFWIERSGDLPDGVVIKLGVTDTPRTPTSTTSTVATTTMADGRRYVFDTAVLAANGETTRYVVIQEQVAANADSGAIEQQVFTIGFAQS